MRALRRLQWSWAFSLVCEVALISKETGLACKDVLEVRELTSINHTHNPEGHVLLSIVNEKN